MLVVPVYGIRCPKCDTDIDPLIASNMRYGKYPLPFAPDLAIMGLTHRNISMYNVCDGQLHITTGLIVLWDGVTDWYEFIEGMDDVG